MKFHRLVIAGAAGALMALGACTDNQSINAATGGLAGAAVGSQFGQGRGRAAATLAGAAVGTAMGGNAPTPAQTRMCTFRNAQTGETWQAPCPN
ncbi:glycine zipper 2TM domain-containing protein [Rhodovulum strictum]|uniref:17 kDa surface antigen n=1 Tax=Rhodovulum strictum TaxID=58314 RepID=A0A844B887_9RHOB|nr:glycine zipper 2TM domain-containing protein [Rhodovulum strictum]MRH22596.1 glycine zipper 2TM domain-containing protein [Rhodovulum strictum]